MDVSSFSDENFDTKAWVNDILKNCDSSDKKETYAMSLVAKLQLYVQQVNKSLEETSQQVLHSMPKIIRESKNLQQEALCLKEKMVLVSEEITKIEKETGRSISSIERLDKIKTELQQAKQGLHESDNWTVLVNELEELFHTKNLEKISEKLVSMQHSLKLLINVADYEDRCLQLEELKNRLEAIASPLIVQAFSSNNLENSAVFARVFRSINRLDQLVKYYNKCHKDVLLKNWRSQLENEQDNVVQLFEGFFNKLLSNWHLQFKWFRQVFPQESTSDVLMEIYIDVMSSLEANMSRCIEEGLQESAEKLVLLQEIKSTIQKFANSIKEIVNSSEKASKDKLKELQKSIYKPLAPYVAKYVTYEQSQLSQRLSTVNCIKEDLQDTIQSLGFSISNVMDIARESLRRCKDITEYCGLCGLLMAFRTFFTSYADQYKVALRQIDRRSERKEDWERFQTCMSLLQNTGDVLHNIQLLEQELTNIVLEENFDEFKELVLGESDKRELESLIKCVREGTRLSLLDSILTEFAKLSADVHQSTYLVVFAPIAVHLDEVQNAKTWAQCKDSLLQSELPEYSLSPQEYITQIGQYLMTLPQHLEPFLFNENQSLSVAMKAADADYLNAGDVEGALADTFLKIVASGTCQSYCERILTISELGVGASRQLAHDIKYLDNVFEDLGLNLSENLQHLMTLLKLAPENYQSQSAGCPPRYVAAIRQMRKLTSK